MRILFYMVWNTLHTVYWNVSLPNNKHGEYNAYMVYFRPVKQKLILHKIPRVAFDNGYISLLIHNQGNIYAIEPEVQIMNLLH